MSRALLKFIRLSPTKARLIAREIQGMNAESALASLEFTPNKAAKIIAKVIASAVANGGYEAKNVIVHSCRVDGGPVLRRFMPRARGRATPIRKPTSHILVEVMTQNEIDSKMEKLKKKMQKSTLTPENKVSPIAKKSAPKSKSQKVESAQQKKQDIESKAKKITTNTTTSRKTASSVVKSAVKKTTKDEDK